MSNQLRVNYAAVYSTVAQLKGSIRTVVNTTDQEYAQLLPTVRTMDSASNANFQNAINRNQRKAVVTAEILEKLVTFIENSARQLERQEQRAVTSFTQSGNARR